MNSILKKFLILIFFLCIHCSTNNNIFPPVPTSVSGADFDMPDPITIIADTTNSQIVVVNSNVDFLYREGSLVTVSVDATDASNPTLAATSALATPNYAGEVAFDGTNVYIPFREGASADSDNDQIIKYTLGSGSIASVVSGTTGENPYGITLTDTTIAVVSDDALNLFDTDLTQTTTIDLTTADEAEFEDSTGTNAESIVIDANTNRAFISNRGDRIFIVNLDTNVLTHVIVGPENTRGIATDGTYIYVIDGNPPSLWIWDPSLVTEATSSPEEIDDSVIVVDVLDLGLDPNTIAIDTTNARAYVTNTMDKSVSVIDLVLREEIARISLDTEDTGLTDVEDPFGLAMGTYNGVPFVFVACSDSNNVAVINASTLKVVAVYP